MLTTNYNKPKKSYVHCIKYNPLAKRPADAKNLESSQDVVAVAKRKEEDK
ncbi:MAG: hypothetical protein QM529_02495 [Hydrotalea sp.]|nr:hypothetical protein [Hydrotalea sp.]